jgi:hypothetical protein
MRGAPNNEGCDEARSHGLKHNQNAIGGKDNVETKFLRCNLKDNNKNLRTQEINLRQVGELDSLFLC